MSEDIYTKVPVDKTAAMVTSKQEYYDGFSTLSQKRVIRSASPLPIDRVVKFSHPSHDLTGKVFSDLTVLGAFPLIKCSSNRKWVVKCVCGYYEAYNASKLKNSIPEANCCGECRVRKMKIIRYNERVRRESAGEFKTERTLTFLRNKIGIGEFMARKGSSFNKRFSVGMTVKNQKGRTNQLLSVTNRKLKFRHDTYSEGDELFPIKTPR